MPVSIYSTTAKGFVPVDSTNPLPVTVIGGGGGGGGTADSTAALQTAGNTSLTSIDGKVATAAKQDTINTTIGTGNTTLTSLLAQAQDVTASGSITTQNLVPAGVATAASSVALTPGGRDTVTIQIAGTYTGALSVQATVDNTNWVTLGGLPLLNLQTGASVATIPSAATGLWQVGAGSFSAIRVTALAAVTGTAAVTMRISDGNGLVALDAALPTGTNVIGGVSGSGTFTVAGTVTNTPAAASAFTLTTAATTNSTLVVGSAKSLYEVTVSNPTATPLFVKFYNKATAPTVGTDTPLLIITVPANGTIMQEFGMGKRFTTGLGYAATGAIGVSDTTASIAGAIISGSYL